MCEAKRVMLPPPPCCCCSAENTEAVEEEYSGFMGVDGGMIEASLLNKDAAFPVPMVGPHATPPLPSERFDGRAAAPSEVVTEGGNEASILFNY